MILRGSALYKVATTNAELSGQRSRVLIDLCHSRTSFGELAMALNCPEAIVRSLLVNPFRSVYAECRGRGIIEELNLDRIPQAQFPSARHDAAAPEQVLIEVREKLSRRLALEVHGWLGSFQASDAERQQAVEAAGLQLDKRTSSWEGKYMFPTKWLVLDLLGICKPLAKVSGNREFSSSRGEWLATWIHFWVADPVIWNRALDLEYAFLGARVQEATAPSARAIGVSDVPSDEEGTA